MGSLWDRNVHPILEMKTPPDGLNPGSGAPGQGCPQDWAFAAPPHSRELNLGQNPPRR